MIIDDVVTQANSLLIHHPDAITDFKLKDGTIIGNLRKDGDELPNGEWMTKQCFWLNAKYIEKVIKNLLDD